MSESEIANRVECGPDGCTVDWLVSERIEVDDDVVAFSEFATKAGWGDGLPLVPPTEVRVREHVAVSGRFPDESLGEVPPRNGRATVEKVAINAVMAGAPAASMPLLLAAVEAMLEPDFNLFALNTTTSCVVPGMFVNGPSRERLKIPYDVGCFGGHLVYAAEEMRVVLAKTAYSPLLKLSFAEVNYADFLPGIQRTATRHRVKMPKEFILITKQLLYFDRYAKALAPKLAALHRIPLVFYGENEAEYGNPIASTKSARRDWEYFALEDKSKIFLGGTSLAELNEEFGVGPNDLQPYLPADPLQIQAKGVEIHYLGYYLKWHPQSCYYYAVEHGGCIAHGARLHEIHRVAPAALVHHRAARVIAVEDHAAGNSWRLDGAGERRPRERVERKLPRQRKHLHNHQHKQQDHLHAKTCSLHCRLYTEKPQKLYKEIALISRVRGDRRARAGNLQALVPSPPGIPA